MTPSKMSTKQLKPYASEYARRMRLGKPGKSKVLRPCTKCGQLCGNRELRYDHPKVCPGLLPAA